jgi:hypothetical protein
MLTPDSPEVRMKADHKVWRFDPDQDRLAAPHAALSILIPALSCRSCRPNAPFAELVRLSRKSIADEMREEHQRRVLGD